MPYAFPGGRRLLAYLSAVALAALCSVVVATRATASTSRAHAHHATHTKAHRTAGRLTLAEPGGLGITFIPWGTVDGTTADLFTLTNGHGMKVNITNYGGVVQAIWVPRKGGGSTNVALGFPSLADYVSDFTQGATQTPWPLPGGSGDTYFGAIIGRYANRIANHKFMLNGKTYVLDANNGDNTLHGGYLGWNTRVWTPSVSGNAGSVSLALSAVLPQGEGCLPALSPGCTGFPASVAATVTYTLTQQNALKISYAATNQSSNLKTVINLTNHTYFNLGGEASGDIYHDLLALNSNKYTPVNTNLIPEPPYFVPVAGTAFDFRNLHPIGEYIRDAQLPDGTSGPFKQLQIAHGYDHNWVLNGYNGQSRLVAVAEDPGTGITLDTYTDQPGVQVYTGNFLVGDLIGTSGHIYRQGDAFTLETQHYPDSPHHIGDRGWPSVVLNPQSTFSSTTAYKFGVAPSGLSVHFH